jgi:hypothetical protein
MITIEGVVPVVKREFVCAILSAVVLLCGCNSLPVPVKNTIPDELYIEVLNATDAPNGVYSKAVNCVVDGDTGIKITREQAEYIISYVKNIEEPACAKDRRKDYGMYSEVSGEHDYLGSVYIHYFLETRDGGTKYYSENKQLFDEYPEGYEDFIKLINEIDSNEQIILGEPLVMSGDAFSKITGFTDDMVTDGTIGEFLDKYPIDIYYLMNYPNGYKFFRINSETYITDVFEYWPMFRALPTEIRNVESTEAEFQAYVEALAKALGADPSKVSDFERGGKIIAGQGLVIYQTCDIPGIYEYSDTLPYHLVDHNYYDGGSMDQDERHTIFYSPDGKFAIAVNGCLERSYLGEWIQPAELYEFYLKIADLV